MPQWEFFPMKILANVSFNTVSRGGCPGSESFCTLAHSCQKKGRLCPIQCFSADSKPHSSSWSSDVTLRYQETLSETSEVSVCQINVSFSSNPLQSRIPETQRQRNDWCCHRPGASTADTDAGTPKHLMPGVKSITLGTDTSSKDGAEVEADITPAMQTSLSFR